MFEFVSQATMMLLHLQVGEIRKLELNPLVYTPKGGHVT